MRLIDADVAIEELTDRSHQAAKRVGTDSPFWEGLVIARRIVNNLPTIHSEPQWIPVSERLPDKSGEYLVTTQWLNGDIDVSLYEYSATYKEWNDGDMCGQKVIAWMPLPKPFEGGAE